MRGREGYDIGHGDAESGSSRRTRRSGRRPRRYPEGTELELDREPIDELDEEELAQLDAALDAGEREYQATGRSYAREDVLSRVRARR